MKVPGVFYNARSFKDVPAGTVIFEEGARGSEMFGIVEGEVEVRLPSGAVRRLGPDDTFGEMAIVDSSPRSATVVAVTDTKLAVIDRHRFLFLVQETPMFALQVMSSIAERLRTATMSLPPSAEAWRLAPGASHRVSPRRRLSWQHGPQPPVTRRGRGSRP